MSDILKPDYERKLNQLKSVENYNQRVRKLELLQKCEDCMFEIKQEQLKQTKIIDFFKKTTLTN